MTNEKKGTYVKHTSIPGGEYWYRHYWDPDKGQKGQTVAVREDPPWLGDKESTQGDGESTQARKSAKLSPESHQRLMEQASLMKGSLNEALTHVLRNHDQTLVLMTLLKKLIPPFWEAGLEVELDEAEVAIIQQLAQEVL